MLEFDEHDVLIRPVSDDHTDLIKNALYMLKFHAKPCILLMKLRLVQSVCCVSFAVRVDDI